MKATSILALIILIFLSLCSCVTALSGFNILLFLCFYSRTAYRVVLSSGGAAAGWMIFWAIAFKPFNDIG